MSSLYCTQGHQNVAGSRFCYLCGEKLQPAQEDGPARVQGVLLGGASTDTLSQRYRILRQLGHGGFGRTYLAEDLTRFNELCVLKEFAPQVQGSHALQKAEELFEREAGALYQLQHPQIPRFRELFRTTFEQQPRLFLVQDYVEGPTYRQILESRRYGDRTFTEAEVTELMRHLLPVLHYIHSMGVIHRDIAPDNLIQRSSDQLPVLIDFGGIKLIAASVASAYAPEPAYLTRVGKVGYAPEEQMQQGKVFPHSDLYALAMTVLVLLTGREPGELGPPDRGLWQQWVSVSPAFLLVLERMMLANPMARYQSATEVMQALEQLPQSFTPPLPLQHHPPSPTYPPSTPDYPPPNYSTANYQTQAPVPPASNMGTVVYPNAAVPSAQRKSGGAGWASALLVLFVLGAVGTGAWLTRSLWLPRGEEGVVDSDPSPYPPDEQARKEVLRQRRQELGVNSSFLVRLTDASFHREHPELDGRSLTNGPEDARWREEWDAIASQYLDTFEQQLSTEARRRMGEFGASDRESWKQAVNRLNVSSRALNDLADARFFQLYPDWRGQDFIDQPIGQVWQAIALDQLQSLQAGDRLERIEFDPGAFNTSVGGDLAAGEGMVYIAQMQQGQLFRMNVQAPPDSTLLSLYVPVPTQEVPVLLEDSSDTQWSGTLPQSGFYEIVVVTNSPDRDRAFGYSVNLAADEVTMTIEPEPSPSPTEDVPIGPKADN
ncbi:protein kinase domain-containing protein [Leptolyngbya sp. AN02str]|uniref:protein kinase domain-containing protein n=1 Tax=Leptolyngbya sp. AN02str TaxID=3423363 RepID=UPI003D313867